MNSDKEIVKRLETELSELDGWLEHDDAIIKSFILKILEKEEEVRTDGDRELGRFY